ncbi:hypothetical protein D3C73_920690 [compost metagenome]
MQRSIGIGAVPRIVHRDHRIVIVAVRISGLAHDSPLDVLQRHIHVSLAVDIRLFFTVAAGKSLLISQLVFQRVGRVTLCGNIARRFQRSHHLQRIERPVLIAVRQRIVSILIHADVILPLYLLLHGAETVVKILGEPSRPLGRFACGILDVVVFILQDQLC